MPPKATVQVGIEGDEGVFFNFDALLPPKGGAEPPPAVLVFGGSTFMGRETVQALVNLPARICIVNRGRSYWGTDDTSDGKAARVIADRKDTELFAARLDVATERLGERWALVADFSAYDGGDIRAALDGLRGRFATYAYVSSDSVYEVSDWAAGGWAPRPDAPRVTEQASDRPDDEAMRRKLRRADSYGDGKLRAEEALAAGLAADPSAGRGVALRLPDVIGPFDDTLRLWAFWHWLQVSAEHPMQVHEAPSSKRARRSEKLGKPDAESTQLALVFSRDVARFIVNLVGAPTPVGAARCDPVNLGCERQPTLREFLELLSRASGLGQPRLAPVARPKTYLPSVDRPWPLDCGRMRELYGFTPTPMEDVLKACAQWFDEACTRFPDDAAQAAKKLPPGPKEAAIARASLPTPPSSAASSSSVASAT